MRRIISILLAALLMAALLAGCSGGGEEEVTPGADFVAPLVLGDTPVTVKEAALGFELDSYELVLTLNNPTADTQEVRLALPVQAVVEDEEDPLTGMKAAAAEITLLADSNRIVPQLHTATYPALQAFDPVLLAPMMDSQHYAQGDLDWENLPVTKYVYIGKGITDVLGLPAFQVPIDTETQRLVVQGGYWNDQGELWCRPFNDYTEVDFDLDNDLLFAFYVIGGELSEEPIWSYNEGTDLTADGVVQLVQKDTLTFDEMILNPQVEMCMDGASLVPGGTHEDVRRPVYRARMLEVLRSESWEGIARVDWFGGNTLYWLEYTLALEPGYNDHTVAAPAYPAVHVDFEPNKYDYTVDARTLNTWADCEKFSLTVEPGEMVELERTTAEPVGPPETKLSFTLCASAEPKLKFKLNISAFEWGLIGLGIAAAAIVITGRMRYAKKLKLAKEGKRL